MSKGTDVHLYHELHPSQSIYGLFLFYMLPSYLHNRFDAVC